MSLQKEISLKHEKHIAEAFNGRLTIGSGSVWIDKSDVTTNDYQIECKATTKPSYQFSIEIINKVISEGYTTGKEPLLAVRVTNKFKRTKDYIINQDNATRETPKFSGRKNVRIDLFEQEDEFYFMLGGKIFRARKLSKFLDDNNM